MPKDLITVTQLPDSLEVEVRIQYRDRVCVWRVSTARWVQDSHLIIADFQKSIDNQIEREARQAREEWD